MKNYILANSWDKSNIANNSYYCMNSAAVEELLTNEQLKFGDTVFIIVPGTAAEDRYKEKMYIMGNDNTLYPM